jgi:hypothetical protein
MAQFSALDVLSMSEHEFLVEVGLHQKLQHYRDCKFSWKKSEDFNIKSDRPHWRLHHVELWVLKKTKK